MGIVIKQTLKGSIFSYLGILVGGINVAFLYPRIFSEEQVGLINLLIAISALAAPLASLGINGATNYYFIWFKDKSKKHNGYFLFMLMVAVIGFLIFTICYFLFRQTILATKTEPSPLILENDIYIIPLTLFSLAFSVMDVYSSVLKDSVIGTLFQEFIFRLLNTLLIVVYYFNFIDFNKFVFLYVVANALPPLAIGWVLTKRGEIFWSWPNKKILTHYRGRIFNVSLFYVVSGLGSLMVTYIDRYMVNYYIGLKAAGIYSITNYFGSIVEVPRRSMGKISVPVIAESWKNNDHDALESFYKKSSLIQTLFGLLIFILLWVNIDSIFTVLPKNYESGREVIFWTGLSVVFNCFFGVGAQILLYSSRYRVYTYLTFILGALVIGTNILFIPILGIVGAAIASAISKLIFSILMISVLKYYYNIKMFSKELLYVVVISIIAYYLGYFIPLNKYFIVNIVVKSSVVTVVFLGILYLLGVFKEYQPIINQTIAKLWKRA